MHRLDILDLWAGKNLNTPVWMAFVGFMKIYLWIFVFFLFGAEWLLSFNFSSSFQSCCTQDGKQVH